MTAIGRTTRRVVLPTAADTAELGRVLGTRLAAGDLVVLAGPLGAGKTCLAQGLGEGLGVEGPVTSPTFVIAREHPPLAEGGVAMVHVDAYRLGGAGPGAGGPDVATDLAADLDALDLDTDLTAAAVVVEWGEGVVEALAPEHLRIVLHRRTDGEERTADLSGPPRLVG